MDNVAATFAMGVNDPAPTISGDGAATIRRLKLEAVLSAVPDD
jgi:hypothetical protein